MAGISLYGCGGCQAVGRAKAFVRFRGGYWCPSCHRKAKAGEPTPRELARADGKDDRGGLTHLVAALAGVKREASEDQA